MSLDGEAESTCRVLVTGANGFLGAHVCRALGAFDADVIPVIRPGSRHGQQPSLSHRLPRIEPPMRFFECDLLDTVAVQELVAMTCPDACIHCAWDVSKPDYLTHSDNQKWVQASLHLARNLSAGGCQWLGVIGTHLEPLGHAPPPNRYAAAKCTLRNRLIELHGDAMTICWWRLFQPYGEGERPERLIPSMIRALTRRERFLVKHPDAQRDFIHAQDVADAIVRSFERRIGGVFDLGGGRLYRLGDVARHAARLLKVEPLLDYGPMQLHPKDATSAADLSALAELANWSPRIDLESGLADLASPSSSNLRATA